MNEFALIDAFFKKPSVTPQEVVFGIGDDAACVKVPPGQELLITTDTLVSNVHFLSTWDAYDIGWKAVMVNLSDIAAMAGNPCWASLALTLPQADPTWLARFSEGLYSALNEYQVTLIGGDLTKGPLSITLTVHGLIPEGKAVRRSTAKPTDSIWVSGDLGAPALAVSFLNQDKIKATEKATLMHKLLRPKPRLDLVDILKKYASSAIDISDGLGADLEHICEMSCVGACLSFEAIPLHPLVKKYQKDNAAYFALAGGDDYEICFTIPGNQEAQFLKETQEAHITCYKIGVIEEAMGFRITDSEGKTSIYTPQGFKHF